MNGKMNVELHFDSCAPNEELRHFIECRLDHALGRYRDRISRVTLQAGAVHEPLDGRDKGCRVRVELTGLGGVVAETAERNVYVAIHRAVDQAGWEASRRFAQSWNALVGKPLLPQHAVTGLAPDRAA